MKTLIIYSSKYGGTEKLANIVKENLSGGAEIVDISEQESVDLQKYNGILIGTSIYAGKARKDIINFCIKNLEELLDKKTGIFISCWFEDKLNEYIKVSFPAELIENAEVVHAGIIADPSNMSFLDKLIVKKVAKMKQPVVNIKDDNIKKLADIFD